jgi:hypothetical protein
MTKLKSQGKYCIIYLRSQKNAFLIILSTIIVIDAFHKYLFNIFYGYIIK